MPAIVFAKRAPADFAERLGKRENQSLLGLHLSTQLTSVCTWKRSLATKLLVIQVRHMSELISHT